MNFRIKNVRARQILNGRGRPAVEVDLLTEDGVLGRASVPSGASRGRFEALELIDGGNIYGGFGVLKAVHVVNDVIKGKIVGMDVRKQREIDKMMIETDGTDNKSRLGANSILGVSLAAAKAASESLGLPPYKYLASILRSKSFMVPYLMLNILWGGKSSGRYSFEDHMIVPLKELTFSESLRGSLETYYALGAILEDRYGRTALAGGNYMPPLKSQDEGLGLIEKALRRAGHEDDFGLAIDVAANQLYNRKKDKYIIFDKELTRDQLLQFYIKLVKEHNIFAIEDPFHEDDFDYFAVLTKELKVMVVGDDLFCTNIRRLRLGVEQKAANAILFKVNQVGTLTEALETAQYARKNRYLLVASMRSSETEDTILSDIAVGIGAGYLKGSVSGGERTSKYNRLLRIDEELQS
ncbi:MAG: phosphopyruvate hydratase [Nitrososphaeria archaeon]